MMISLWPLLVVGAVGVVLVIVLLAGRRLFPGTRPGTRAFWCPLRERDVVVEFQEAVWDGRWVDVSRCTVFSPPTAVTCSKGCMTLVHLPPPREAGVEAASRDDGVPFGPDVRASPRN